jgi:hypothetical protein
MNAMNVPIIHNDLQVGVGAGRVVLGINKTPMAMLSAPEAIMLASLLLKHASSIMADKDKKDTREQVPDETLGMGGPSPNIGHSAGSEGPSPADVDPSRS